MPSDCGHVKVGAVVVVVVGAAVVVVVDVVVVAGTVTCYLIN